MRKPLSAFLLLTFCLIAVANGQGTASRVTGTVVDEKGSVVPGALVTLTNEATQVSLTTEYRQRRHICLRFRPGRQVYGFSREAGVQEIRLSR